MASLPSLSAGLGPAASVSLKYTHQLYIHLEDPTCNISLGDCGGGGTLTSKKAGCFWSLYLQYQRKRLKIGPERSLHIRASRAAGGSCGVLGPGPSLHLSPPACVRCSWDPSTHTPTHIHTQTMTWETEPTEVWHLPQSLQAKLSWLALIVNLILPTII